MKTELHLSRFAIQKALTLGQQGSQATSIFKGQRWQSTQLFLAGCPLNRVLEALISFTQFSDPLQSAIEK